MGERGALLPPIQAKKGKADSVANEDKENGGCLYAGSAINGVWVSSCYSSVGNARAYTTFLWATSPLDCLTVMEPGNSTRGHLRACGSDNGLKGETPKSFPHRSPD